MEETQAYHKSYLEHLLGFGTNIYDKFTIFTAQTTAMKHNFTGQLKIFIDKAENGSVEDVDYIMRHLTSDSTFETTRYVDYSLGLVVKPDGVEQIGFYLFNGTTIQRNYASLYFNRSGDWKRVKQAFELGLIDETQAYAR